MYTKTVNGQQIFSKCLSLRIDGVWVSRPSAEQIAADGWVEHVPPVVEPQPQTEPDFQEVVESVKKFLSTETNELSDEDALAVAALYPTWASKIGEGLTVGMRLWYDGKLYKVIQAHTAQDNWTPDNTPALYAEVSIEEFPEWKQPLGSEDSYMTGDKVSFSGSHWVSDVDNNVWTPGTYGWTELS